MTNMTLTVLIHDESDPVLAIVTGPVHIIPVVYRDYRALYLRQADRTANNHSKRLFAEWVVGEFLPEYEVESSFIPELNYDEQRALNSEFLSVVYVSIEDESTRDAQQEQDLCGVMSRGKLYGPCVLDEGHPRSEPHQDGLGKVFYRNES